MAKKKQNEIDLMVEEEEGGSGGEDEYAFTPEDDEDGEKKPPSGAAGITLSKAKITLIYRLLKNIKENNDQVIDLLSGLVDPEAESFISIGQKSDSGFHKDDSSPEQEIVGGRIVEGVFDGEKMIGPDGKQYSVPANYASKSKLVEGDIMKLTITPGGTFVYKQIGPIERTRLIGRLELEGGGSYSVNVNGRKLHVLTASVTFFKGQAGDEVVVLVPKEGDSGWAAVENIVRKNN